MTELSWEFALKNLSYWTVLALVSIGIINGLMNREKKKGSQKDMKLNPKYQAILKLNELLDKKKIPHELTRRIDGWKIAYPNERYCIFDAIEHHYSYGSDEDLMEVWEEGVDDVIGHLDVETVLRMFEKIHEEKGFKKNE